MPKNIIILLTLLLSNTLYASIGKIASLKGEVYVQNEKGKKSAKIGSFIYLKDIIITKQDSKALLKLNDDTTIAVGKNTDLAVEKYIYNPKISSKNNLELKFFKGVFRTITGEIGKLNKQKFKINTPSASIGIRGTTFLVQVEQEQLQVGVEKGGVYLASSKEGTQPIDILADQFITFANATGKFIIEPFSKWIQGQKIKTDLEKMVEITNSLPSWILRPKVKGSISSIGVAGYNKHGLEVMLLEAQMDAKAKLAGKLQMEVSHVQKKVISSIQEKNKDKLNKAFSQASKELVNNIPLKNFDRINMYQAKDGTLYVHMIIDEKEITNYLFEQRRTYMKKMLEAGYPKEQILQTIKSLSQQMKEVNLKE